MTFQLSPQLEADANSAFALYRKYVENFKYKFPSSVLELIANPDWYGGVSSKAPHDGLLSLFTLTKLDSESSQIELLVTKPWLNLTIRIRYVDVCEFNIGASGPPNALIEWRYEQFRFFDAFHAFQIKDKKYFTHDIELVDGTVWNITAANIDVRWEIAP
jgi:hypothetical protein